MNKKKLVYTENNNEDTCDTSVCPVITTLSVIGGKWKPAILWEIQQHGVMRFGEIKRSIAGVTQKMLAQQLRELEEDGIITRKIYAEVPPRVEYDLTDYGCSLSPVLREMAEWGAKHQHYEEITEPKTTKV